MTLGPNEHPMLKFHQIKSEATYSPKLDFLQPVVSIQAVSSVLGRTQHKLSSAVGRQGVSRSLPL